MLEEANAIGSTANFALMLPEPAQKPIISLPRDYTAVRIGSLMTPPSWRVMSPAPWNCRMSCGSREWR